MAKKDEKRGARRPWHVGRRLIRLVLLLIFLAVGAGIALLLPAVQTGLARYASAKLNERLGVHTSIQRVELRLFGPNRVHGLFVADLNGDTLVAVDELWVRGLRFDAMGNAARVRRIELHRSRFNLLRAEDDPHTNLTNLLDKLAADKPDEKSRAEPWTFRVDHVDIRDLHFTHGDAHSPRRQYGVDVDHVDIPRAKVIGRDLWVSGDSVGFTFDDLSFQDHSGLVVEKLSARAKVSPRGIELDQLHLLTGGGSDGRRGSDIRGDVKLLTEDLSDLEEFESRVFMETRFDSSLVQFADVALFAPELRGLNYPLRIQGEVKGQLDGLKGRGMVLAFGDASWFRGDVEMSGLPDFANTFILLRADAIHLTPADLAAIPVPPFTGGRTLQVPPEVQRMGPIAYSGNFTGFINSFTTYGTAHTGAGELVTDLSYERDTLSGFIRLNGRLATTGFDVGRILKTDALGRVALNTRLTAQGRDLASVKAELEGQIDELGLEHYTIRGITLNGKLERNLFNGELHCRDPLLNLDFNGLADLRGTWPEVDFNAEVVRMDLRGLGLIAGEGYSDLQMRVDAKGLLAPDSLHGYIRMEDVSYCEDSIEVALGDILLEATRPGNIPHLSLHSPVVDAEVHGRFLPTQLAQAAQSTFFSVFPALSGKVAQELGDQDFTFVLSVKEAQPLLDIVAPDLEVAPGATATGWFRSLSLGMGIDATLPGFAYKGYRADSLQVMLDKNMDLLVFGMDGDARLFGDSVKLHDLKVTGTAYQDEVQLDIDWVGGEEGSGSIDLSGLVQGPNSILMDLGPSLIDLGAGAWTNAHTSRIRIDSTTIAIDSLLLVNDDQYIDVRGMVSKDPSRSLVLALEGVRLENFAPLFDVPQVKGRLSGDGRVFDLRGAPYLLSYLCIDSIAVEGRPVGDLRFNATLNEHLNEIAVNGVLERGTLRAFDFAGFIRPGQENELDLQLRMDRLDIRFIDPFLPEAVSQLQGKVTGQVEVSGRFNDPRFNGSADLDQAGVRINYLNTFYSFSHRVNIYSDMFTLDQVVLHDDEGHTGLANATIIHDGLKDWNFDVGMVMDGLKVLDTDAGNNELYYGKAYAKGDVGISGYAGNLRVYVDAATGAGTDIHFPLGSSQEVGAISFVHFIGPDERELVDEPKVDLTGVSLDMNVRITEAAKFELIFDPTVGDIMRGRGNGNITMTVTPTGAFSMKGGVELVEGDYLFTLRNLVNKRFGIEPGGRVTWYGDPFDALIDVQAVYRLRAGLYDVIPPALRTEAYKKRFPVEVVMHLTQNLMNPEIAFDVRLPTVDEAVRTQVKSALGDPDEMNKQVFALIVLNRFVPSDDRTASAEGGGIGGGASATGTELLSNQLSNWLSSFSNTIDLGVNWRTGDQISQDEFEVALSTAIFNERLHLNTNVGMAYGTSTATQNTNTFIGDFSVEYSITQDGKLRVKAFSQSNDRNLNQVDQAQTTQGAGLAYREEFDTLGEFLRKLGRLFTGNKRK